MVRKNVIVIDDHDIFNLGLKIALEKDPFYKVVGEAKSKTEFVELLKTKHCDLVISDYMLPDANGIELLVEAKKKFPNVKTILISSIEKRELEDLCNKSKIDAYVLKSSARSSILEISNLVFKNHTFSPKLEYHTNNAIFSKLTKKEIKTLELWSQGKSLDETADSMNINAKTVETHRANIKKKFAGFSKSEIFSLFQKFKHS